MAFRVGGGRFGNEYQKPIEQNLISSFVSKEPRIYRTTFTNMRAEWIEQKGGKLLLHFIEKNVKLGDVSTPLTLTIQAPKQLTRKHGVNLGMYLNVKIEYSLLPKPDLNGSKVAVHRARIIGI